MVIKIPREKIKKIDIVNIQGGLTASEVYNKYKPDYMINLALYDMASGTNITHLKDEGVESGYLFSEYGIGIIGDNEIAFCNKSDKKIRDFVAGSPVLVINSQKSIDWGNKKSAYVAGSHIRSAIGFNADEIILFGSDKKMDLDELSQALISEDCKFAINCDGGGSCHLQKGEKVYSKSVRSNASWFLIYTEEEKKMPKICLDQGHGISTNGKRSPDGTLLEYEFNRDIANRIKAILERHNVEVVLTCTDTKDLTLTKRCKIANEKKADYFVSIHANAFYYKDEKQRDIVEYNDVSGWEVHIISKGGKAEQLAKKIHKHSQELGLKDRGIKVSNFQVLRDTDMPAVLIEHGFYTNKNECENLKSDSFRQKCAECDAKGILEQLGIEYKAKDINVSSKDELVLTIGKKEYIANGQVKEMDVAPFIKDGRTYVPIVVLRDAGCQVDWNETNQTVTVRGKFNG